MAVELEEEMLAAAEDLRFEYAAQLRDELRELRRDLQEIRGAEAPAASAGAPADANASEPVGDETPTGP